MPGFTRTRTIKATPTQVFETITDLEQAPAYIPGIVKVQPLSDQPFGQGYQWKETRSFKILGFIPMRASSKLTVADYDKRARTYSTTFDDGCNFVSYRFDVAKADKGAKLSLKADCKGIGKYEGNTKVAEKLNRTMQKYDGDLLDRIKVHVEANA